MALSLIEGNVSNTVIFIRFHLHDYSSFPVRECTLQEAGTMQYQVSAIFDIYRAYNTFIC